MHLWIKINISSFLCLNLVLQSVLIIHLHQWDFVLFLIYIYFFNPGVCIATRSRLLYFFSVWEVWLRSFLILPLLLLIYPLFFLLLNKNDVPSIMSLEYVNPSTLPCIMSSVSKIALVFKWDIRQVSQLKALLCLYIRFKVVDLLTMASQHQNAVLDAEQERPMLEGALTFLVILCSLRIHLG